MRSLYLTRPGRRSALLAVLITASTVASWVQAKKSTEQKRLQMIASAMAGIPQTKQDRTLSPYFFVLGEDLETDRLPLKSTSAEVKIAGVIASVNIEQVYMNQGSTTLEAIYIFPASTRAAIHAMKMTVGYRVVEAEIKKRAEAQKIYSKARKKGQTASLLEQQRPNVFQMSVANILPGDEIRVEISYTELMVPEQGIYEFVYPAVVGPRYCNTPESEASEQDLWVENPHLRQDEPAPYDFDIGVRISSGIPISNLLSPSHDIDVQYSGEREAEVSLRRGLNGGNRDFVLRYSLAGQAIDAGLITYEGEEENFFLAMIEPPARVAPKQIVPREYIFILDVSGSMNGFPLDVSKRLIKDILNKLDDADSFNVLLFAGSSEILSERSLVATNKNVKRAVDWIDLQRGGGGTELVPALERSLALPKEPGTSRIVVVATDGYVMVEKRAFDIVRDNLGKANLFAFGIGTSVNRALIEGLAHAGMGESFVVTDEREATKKAHSFIDYVSSPVLQGVECELQGFGAYDVEPVRVPDLFASRPIVLFGKFRGEPKGTIRIKGHAAFGTWSREIDVAEGEHSKENKALKYLWARHRIRRLADMSRLGENDDRKKEVTDLGLKYHLMTDYTSFVAVDTEIRADGKKKRKVRQPLPLPQGVSDLAVGNVVGYVAGAAMGVSSGSGWGGLGLSAIGHGGGGGSGSGYGRGTVNLAGRRAVAPAIVSSAAVVKGSLSKEVIRRIIRRHINEVKHCYELELANDPKLAGKVVVRFTIDSSGKVGAVQIVESTLGDKAVEECIVKAVGRLTFPAVADSTTVVTYPFQLRSK
jgi:Ca-activated chloride channel family protein